MKNNFYRRCVNSVKYIINAINVNLFWFGRSVKYSMFYRGKDFLTNRLLIIGHGIEKGITMPNRRLGFGLSNVRNAISLCNEYLEKHGNNGDEFQIILNILREYLQIHENANYELPNDVCKSIRDLLKNKTINDNNCFELSKELFFHKYSTFSDFAYSRHSCRHFSNENISDQIIKDVVTLAKTAPSACNRQSVRVYCLSGTSKDFILSIQNGNRGFGKSINKILMITFKQPSYDYDIQNAGYLDAGIFTMNLLYALHDYKLGACTLNAFLNPKNIRKIYKETGINETEVPVVFIGIGIPAENINVANSARITTEEILRFV